MQYNRYDQPSTVRPHLPANLPHVQVEITSGRVQHRFRKVHQKAYLIGSGRDCDLVLGDPKLDEIVGYLLITPQGVWIRQLGAPSDLMVNGRPTRSMLLLDKDRVQVGPFEIRLHIQATPFIEPIVEPKSKRTMLPSTSSPTNQSQRPRLYVETSHRSIPRPKFLDLPKSPATPELITTSAVSSQGAQQANTAPPRWQHLSHDLITD